MIYHLKAIATGKIEDLPYSTKRPMRSALNKTLFTGKMWLSKTGFSEDEQEYKGHGGPNKAVCLYSEKITIYGKMMSQIYQNMQCLART